MKDPLYRFVDMKLDVSREYTISDLLYTINPSAKELVLDIVDDFIDSIVSLVGRGLCGTTEKAHLE
jgi:hypothetical protein